MFTTRPDPTAAMLVRLCSNGLDSLAGAATADAALAQADALRRVIAGPGLFSIHMNVTTAGDPPNEVRLRRVYSSRQATWPVAGGKRKTHTVWTDTLFVRGEPIASDGIDALQRHFDDHAQIVGCGIRCALNIPMMRGNQCFATFNVFGTAPGFQAHQVLGLRVLALATAGWLVPAPNLHYVFDQALPSQAADTLATAR